MSEPTVVAVWAVECPGGCGATGAEVYQAEAHPTSCDWMMKICPRCSEHDELLRPDEPSCPYPDVPEETPNPHGRG